MKYRNEAGPFYRKFMVGDLAVEINEDGKGGLWLHLWNLTPDGIPAPHPVFHLDSEEQFLGLCTRLLGLRALENFEELWREHGG